jgi:poly(3-hydroxybutyrate) depolymerase
VQETQCYAAGWQRLVLPVAGLPRLVLWKAPPGAWSGGAIVVMHGGGGQHTNFCVANVALIAPQVRFTAAALAQGYAVFLLDSSDRVTDREGRLCGKVWDDELRARPNLDLPFVEELLRVAIPARRPAGSRADLYLTGLSSGGYMTTRAATHLGDLVTAFAPVSSGDPYGWFRDCSPRPGDRANVFGAAFDNETRRQITEPGACDAAATPNEQPWDGVAAARRPPFRLFHHAQDGIHDRSCAEKLRRQLVQHGYPETPPFTLDGGTRSADAHYWQDAYNAELLAFFASQRR